MRARLYKKQPKIPKGQSIRTLRKVLAVIDRYKGLLLVSILIGFFIPATLNKWVLTAIKLAIMPLVMGLGYELIKICGRHDNWLTRIIAAPGLWFQRITVLEPDDAMIECAIVAMKEAIPDDGSDKI